MLHIFKKLGIGLGAFMLLFSCSKDMEDVSPSSSVSGTTTAAAKATNTENSPLNISGITSTDGKTWSFTLQKTADGNVPNIGALLLTLMGCDDKPIALSAAKVVSASVTGTATQVLAPSYKEGGGSACNMTEVPGYLRLTNFTEKLTDGRVYTVTFTLNHVVQVKSAKVWARISNTCYTTTIAGPGCELDTCGEGQGYFHKSEHWPVSEITIGGHTYAAAEAVKLITSDKKEGGSDNKGGIADSKAAFAQGVTVLLNRELGWISPTAYAAELATIEAYLSALQKLNSYSIDALPTGNADAKAAAGYIGDNINCEDAE